MNWVNLIISGTVTGVGYRSWAQIKALELGLTGWVKNKSDGVVEIMAQGERNNLEKFLDFCWQGPEAAWVEDIKAAWGEAHSAISDFKIIE
jgi:acylphosphatase